MSLNPKYNGEKADIFSIGATIFMTKLLCPAFGKAVTTDPYYKRLVGPMK